jgi:hypothetical protein
LGIDSKSAISVIARCAISGKSGNNARAIYFSYNMIAMISNIDITCIVRTDA